MKPFNVLGLLTRAVYVLSVQVCANQKEIQLQSLRDTLKTKTHSALDRNNVTIIREKYISILSICNYAASLDLFKMQMQF